jgi:hypothetical protein
MCIWIVKGFIKKSSGKIPLLFSHNKTHYIEGDYAVEAFFTGFNFLYSEFSIRAETEEKKRIFLQVNNPSVGGINGADRFIDFSYRPNKPKRSKDPDYSTKANDPDNWVTFDVLTEFEAKGSFAIKVYEAEDDSDVQTVSGTFDVVFD